MLFRSKLIKKAVEQGRKPRILNLFAYTGGATMAFAAAGAAEVVHVDASKGMVQRAKENMAASSLEDCYIRFIVEDCGRFVERDASPREGASALGRAWLDAVPWGWRSPVGTPRLPQSRGLKGPLRPGYLRRDPAPTPRPEGESIPLLGGSITTASNSPFRCMCFSA